MLVAGIVTWGWVEDGEPTGKVLVRMAIVFGAFWLAMPQLEGLIKNIGGQYALLIGIVVIVAMFTRGGVKGIIPVVVLAALALGGLQVASRMFGAGSSRQE